MTDLRSDMTSSTPTIGRANRVVDAVTHGSSLLFVVVVSVAVGRPLGWIAFLLPVAPAAIVGTTRLLGRTPPRGRRSLLAFDLLCALMIGSGWMGTRAGTWWAPLAYLFPLALLAFTLGLVNYVLVTISRTYRAMRGHRFEYPWIPARLAVAFGIDEKENE